TRTAAARSGLLAARAALEAASSLVARQRAARLAMLRAREQAALDEHAARCGTPPQGGGGPS
ncbi:flagellar FliJ family protein, partial [Acidisphaera rubrifaciens]|uniref:flagellar FliJ family protein n=1 Tax=Acidisphaera rubrifaciens TaxID=50715 RepID=UPI0011DE2A9A